MADEIADYELHSYQAGIVARPTITVPTEAEQVANELMCKARAAAIVKKDMEYDEFVAVPRISDALDDYGIEIVRSPLLRDRIVLMVAEVIASREGSLYASLLGEITEKERHITEVYGISRMGQ